MELCFVKAFISSPLRGQFQSLLIVDIVNIKLYWPKHAKAASIHLNIVIGYDWNNGKIVLHLAVKIIQFVLIIKTRNNKSSDTPLALPYVWLLLILFYLTWRFLQQTIAAWVSEIF